MKHHLVGPRSIVIPVVLALAVFGLASCSKSEKILGPDAGAMPDSGGTMARLPADNFARTVHVPLGSIDDHHFVAYSTNRWFPLVPGTTFYYRSVTPDGIQTQTDRVTHDTMLIDGVRVRVVTSVVKLDGKTIEVTRDYFAMDEDKNVWYFGEDTKSIDPVTGATSTEGTFRQGRDGAKAGIIMLGDPDPGEMYNEEKYTGVAEDQARVLTLHGDNNSPYTGDFGNGLKTENTTPLEPDQFEYKYYVPGVGLVLEVEGDLRNKLVKITHSDGDDEEDLMAGIR